MVTMDLDDIDNAIFQDMEDTVNENGKRSNQGADKEAQKRIKTKGLYRQPTVRELNRLQETESLFNSNLFRLQVDEILQEVNITEKVKKKFNEWYTPFKNHLNTIREDSTEFDLSEPAIVKKLKVKLPLPKTVTKTKCIFQFRKFRDIEISGSYALDCAINSKLKIDILITVPAEIYTKNDSVNYRYHRKRAAYLAYIASHLKEFEEIELIQYAWLNGCITKPILQIIPSVKYNKYFNVQVNLCCEEDTYKLQRLHPSRNNLRESFIFSSENSNNDEVGPPTPYYNCSILSDVTLKPNKALLEQILTNSENLKQAIILLKIWLRQRKLQVSGYIISLFVAYLVQLKRINNIMSSYQIVRNVWISLKSSEWNSKGISLQKEKDPSSIEEFHKHFSVVFLDVTGVYNICWQMCTGTYLALKRESEIAVDLLDNGKINSFMPLFMVQVKPLTYFDHIIKFQDLEKLKEFVIQKSSMESRVNYGLDHIPLVSETLYSLLSRGLGDRADLILPIVDGDFSWPLKKTLEKALDKNREKMMFGLILQPENSTNIIDKGPQANLPEAEEFRAFWGEKSELRRFQDGSITETCVWQGDSIAERRSVVKQIVDYLLELKYNILPSDTFHIYDQFDSLLTSKVYSASDMNVEEGSVRVLQAFDELRRDVRLLTDLPLDITAVYGVSPVFSYCDPLPPPPRCSPLKPYKRGSACLIKDNQDKLSLPEYTPVCKAVIELGHSGKWPGDLEAFRCLKAAFHLQIAERLNVQHSLPTQAYPTYVDVFKNGVVFRLEISHTKEITLLQRVVENGVVKLRENDDSVNMMRDNVLLPRVRGGLHGLHQKHPAFGPSACIFQRWLSSHLLLGHCPSLTAQLLSAAAFTNAAVRAPTRPTAAFFHTLRMLVETDWEREILIIDFDDDLTREQTSEIESQFSTRDENTPNLVLVTSYDGKHPSIWTRNGPTKPVLARLQALAKSTLQYMEKGLIEDMKENVLGAFVPSLSGYDVLIHLYSSLVPFIGERLDMEPQNKEVPSEVGGEVIPVVEFNPVEKYLEELRSAYGEFALFFHDSYGGDTIAVLWKPNVHEKRDFQIFNPNALCKLEIDGEVKFKVNTEAIIEDFKIIGRGLVRDVTVSQ